MLELNEISNRDGLAIVEQTIQQLKESGNLEIEPCQKNLDLTDKIRYKKLELSPSQKIHVSALMQQMQMAAVAGQMAHAYVVVFPKGLPKVLTELRQGGYGTMIRENGKFVGTASLYAMSAQAFALSVLTAMSAVSGQYFLSRINGELKIINQKLDEILDFLYGDKKAELLSELNFTKYAFQNYNSIMAHEYQRVATITNLQESKKIAMKDIEFYLADLEDEKTKLEKAFQIKKCLDLAMQLYFMSGLLEVYYTQNCDLSYTQYLREDMSTFIEKCNSRILSIFSALKGRKAGIANAINKKKSIDDEAEELIISLKNGEGVITRKIIDSAFQALVTEQKYYLNNDGEIYMEVA